MSLDDIIEVEEKLFWRSWELHTDVLKVMRHGTVLHIGMTSICTQVCRNISAEYIEDTKYAFFLKCIDGPIVRAESISENVQEFTRQVCHLKLQEFLERYGAFFILTIGVSMVPLLLSCPEA